MFDAGITLPEFNKIARQKAVRVATQRVANTTGRESKSRVAIMTGIPRSDVGKILDSPEKEAGVNPDKHPARRVLAAWYDDPLFATSSGEPAVLSIFGKWNSFEKLVGVYGGGLPVRAMLDELTEMNAIERLPDQKLKAKARVPILSGLTARSVAAIGERGRDLLQTLTYNIRNERQPLFESTALIDETDVGMIPVIRREIAQQGIAFIDSATSLLNRSQKKLSKNSHVARAKHRVGVTVYYFQDEVIANSPTRDKAVESRRKNLRRMAKKQTRKRLEVGI